MDAKTRMQTPVTVTAADIRDATWIIGQFVRIVGMRMDVIEQMTRDDPDFAVGMCHLANRFAGDRELATIDDELSAVEIGDIMHPLVEWSNTIQQLAMDATSTEPVTSEEQAARHDRCAKVQVIDSNQPNEFGI